MKRKMLSILLVLTLCLGITPVTANAKQSKATAIKTPVEAVSEMTWGVNLADLYIADIGRPQGSTTGYYDIVPFAFAMWFWNEEFTMSESREANGNVITVSFPFPKFDKNEKVEEWIGGLFAVGILTRIKNQKFKISLSDSKIVKKNGKSTPLNILNGTYKITASDGPDDNGYWCYMFDIDKSKLPKPGASLNDAKFETKITVIDAPFASGKAKADYFFEFERVKMNQKVLTDQFLEQGVNVIRFLPEGEAVTLTKYSVFCDSIRCRDCFESARSELTTALSVPLQDYYDDQRAYLKSYWDNCLLEIDGDDGLTQAIYYNMYQLIQSVGKDEYCNIAAKGLSGEGYEGHYFWDTEMYIQPFFNLTQPSVTKNLISFRYNTLQKARENARLMGHMRGVLYPWRTITGSECSGYFPSGSATYHINGDIAYSVVAYYLATKDLDFIEKEGAEIVFETARLWLDVGNYYHGRFHINAVTGPDEYTCLVNNNYYTNAAAQFNLRWAVKFYELLRKAGRLKNLEDKLKLSEKEIDEFGRAAELMYLPYDEEMGINPQDDSFLQKKRLDLKDIPLDKRPLLLFYHPLFLYRHQVCKQADTVLAHFIFEDAQDEKTIRKSFEYYERITTHDSSLSTCIFSIVASKLGLVEKAYNYFGDSAELDLFNTHKNTRDGIHTANMGGSYMAVVYGFGGLRIKESGIYFAPVIPKSWKEYRFKVNYEDSQIHVEVQADRTSFTLVKGSPKMIHVYGRTYELNDLVIIPPRQ